MKMNCQSVKGTSFTSLELKKEAGGKAHWMGEQDGSLVIMSAKLNQVVSKTFKKSSYVWHLFLPGVLIENVLFEIA